MLPFVSQANVDTTSSYGKHSRIASIAYPSQPSSMKKYSQCMAVYRPTCNPWSRYGESCDQLTYPTPVSSILPRPRDSRPSCYSKKIGILIAHVYRAFMRPAMVGSRQGHHWLVRERQRCIIHIWAGCRLEILTKARYGLDLSSSPGTCTFFSSLIAHIATSTRRW